MRGLHYIRRPETATAPSFDLAYVRTGPPTPTPTVVLPGGPGLASMLPYGPFRRWAARGGLDLIMIEHRGVGRSRRDLAGRDLPYSALWVTAVLDDIAAVLDHERVRTAYIAGSSYGSYLASAFGVQHPDRVAGMLLDSALQSAEHLDLERRVIRQRFWHAGDEVAQAIRALSGAGGDQGRLLDVVRAAYELGGDELLRPLLRQRLRGRRGLAWRLLETFFTRSASFIRIPGIYEFDIAGAIGFRELRYGARGDGLPMDPGLTYAALAERFPSFAGEHFDLPRQTPGFTWPIALLVGRRDLRTPPAIARRVAETAQDAALVEIDNGHSALDTHPMAFLSTLRWLTNGERHRIPAAADHLSRMPRRGPAARFPALLTAALRVESSLRR